MKSVIKSLIHVYLEPSALATSLFGRSANEYGDVLFNDPTGLNEGQFIIIITEKGPENKIMLVDGTYKTDLIPKLALLIGKLEGS